MQEAGLQQITARTLHTPVGNQPRQHAKDSHCSEASVMWNQNDMFKSDAASLSSGTRCTDAITRAQVRIATHMLLLGARRSANFQSSCHAREAKTVHVILL